MLSEVDDARAASIMLTHRANECVRTEAHTHLTPEWHAVVLRYRPLPALM